MKAQTKKEALKIKKELLANGKSDVRIHRFAEKRKFQFFVGSWWEWMAQIS